MRVQRHTSGSVRFDKRRRTWNYLWYDGGIRLSKLIGNKRQFPTKAAAWKEVERVRPDIGQTEAHIGDTMMRSCCRAQSLETSKPLH